MTIGLTFYDWRGRPAIVRGGQVRFVGSPGEGWGDETLAPVATIAAEAVSIGSDEFDTRFSGPPWNLPDLDGWYQRRDPSRTISWRDIRRN